MPNCLLIFFNASLVVGIARGLVNLPVGSQTNGKNGERRLAIITVAITASYVLFTIPIMIYITGFASYVENRCSDNHPKEVLRAVGNTLQLFEHIIHIAFYVGLNERFRKELKYLLRLAERPEEAAEGLGDAIGGMTHYGADGECMEKGQRKGNHLELAQASPSSHSNTPSQPTLSQDLNASTYENSNP